MALAALLNGGLGKQTIQDLMTLYAAAAATIQSAIHPCRCFDATGRFTVTTGGGENMARNGHDGGLPLSMLDRKEMIVICLTFSCSLSVVDLLFLI